VSNEKENSGISLLCKSIALNRSELLIKMDSDGKAAAGWPDEFVTKSPKLWPNPFLVKINT
jgi:hypothetical protein